MLCTANCVESSGKIPSWSKTQITLSCLFSCCSCICHLWGFWHESVLFIPACIFRLFTATEHLHICSISSKMMTDCGTVHVAILVPSQALSDHILKIRLNITNYSWLPQLINKKEYIYSIKETPNLNYKLVYVKVFSHVTFMKRLSEDI